MKGLGAAAQRRGSQKKPESVHVVGRDARKNGRAACSLQTRSDSVRIEALVDGQKESCEGIGNGRVTKGKIRVIAAASRGAESQRRKACVWQAKVVAKGGKGGRNG